MIIVGEWVEILYSFQNEIGEENELGPPHH